MKILCEKCGENITVTVGEQLEKNRVGHPICPKCNKKQKRYISEADLLIYLSFSELLYFLLSLITTLLFDWLGLKWYTIVILIIMFAATVIVTWRFKANLYQKGYFKKDLIYTKFDEDGDKISKSIRWQFILFFAIVITFVTEHSVFYYFAAMALLSVILTIIKARLAINKERKIVGEQKENSVD